MAGETTLTIMGNLVDDPELKFTPAGHAVAKFRVASTPRTFDKQANEWRDGDGLFLTVTAWRTLAQNVAESLTRGSRVIVRGALKQRSYEDREGVKRTVYEIEAEDIGPSLLRATAAVTKTTGNGNNGQQQAQQQPTGGYGAQRPQQPQNDQWNTSQPQPQNNGWGQQQNQQTPF
ncbi:single-stranded DNA-binding protein [Streptomyces salyersiae]|uniref:Single-stranded DNA-binding protein n=1 Tax=Streptomyces salyersiae TaxID=3075530 RepID=A0ABU2RZF0_9ACTN|nr:single-stranded DNA-binding protein [Streptomyces sp. DSM 41770]MDT0432779.1 single-stranded DNA-binding protein [Streptomyces sp. DSM 41770]